MPRWHPVGEIADRHGAGETSRWTSGLSAGFAIGHLAHERVGQSCIRVLAMRSASGWRGDPFPDSTRDALTELAKLLDHPVFGVTSGDPAGRRVVEQPIGVVGETERIARLTKRRTLLLPGVHVLADRYRHAAIELLALPGSDHPARRLLDLTGGEQLPKTALDDLGHFGIRKAVRGGLNDKIAKDGVRDELADRSRFRDDCRRCRVTGPVAE